MQSGAVRCAKGCAGGARGAGGGTAGGSADDLSHNNTLFKCNGFLLLE